MPCACAIAQRELHLCMNRNFNRTFLLLVVSQTVHSLEEYIFELWEHLYPARFLSGLVSEDLPFGFAVINSVIVVLIFLSYRAFIRGPSSSATKLAWFWAILETANGAAHLGFGVSSGGYFPGLYTAPFLLVLGGILLRQLMTAVPSSGEIVSSPQKTKQP